MRLAAHKIWQAGGPADPRERELLAGVMQELVEAYRELPAIGLETDDPRVARGFERLVQFAPDVIRMMQAARGSEPRNP